MNAGHLPVCCGLAIRCGRFPAALWRVEDERVSGRVLLATLEHPFYVRGRGWVAARELQPGDELRSHDGRWLPIEGVRNAIRQER